MAQGAGEQAGFTQDLPRAELERARVNFCCCVEAGRQASALIAQAVDALVSETNEVQRQLLQNTGEHVEIGFRFTEQIIEAGCLDEVLYVQSKFAQHAANSYARQVRDLLRLVILFVRRHGEN
jgi:hypothetical protein